ncbi:DNA recombination and repair protein RecO [hydrothermal vent metagenome]|uniref:DNA repair protein RecO n=1 Tax=hydrothermal vent metagenome TaxID=652676 RepID=A0A3B0Z2Z8_9ZZZZ
MPRTRLQPAYLLHHRPYRETSSILELFTAEYGRVAVVAKGVRRKKSRLQPLLQLYRPLLLSWRGRGPLYSLDQVEENGAMHSLAGISMMSGFYINELLVRLLHHEEAYPALYATYELLLQQLSQGDLGAELEWLLRQFELRLLHDLGYALNLECEVETGEVLRAEQRYHYLPEQGAVYWQGSGVGVPLHGATLLGLASGELSEPRSRREAKRLMRSMLASLLGDKPLNSRELIRQMM